ncbi:transposase [Candidatus Poribacteria bacterium]
MTICTHNRKSLFGQISDGGMLLDEFGEIARDEWIRTPQIRGNAILDEYVIMPNHLHGIVVISQKWGVSQCASTGKFRSPSQSIGAIIRGYKGAVTKQINQMRKSSGLPVWQRNYWEHVIRNEKELNKAREYIRNNPLKWELDRENPANMRR